ncbi:MAG TPA: TonB-dependent receptor [Candidatus Sulfotelmatobacter sp.]|nr:TonB-dependent receptor [Candidatus Sulfotelmatobacter sp.]
MRFPQITFVFFLVVLTAFPLLAQSPNGAINGLVLDPSNRAIAGADILAINDVTGVKYSSKTNDGGIYVVPNLPPGPYRLQVSKVGFKTLVKPDIVLNVQDALSINFSLPIGAVFETMTIEGGAPLVNTESASVSSVVDRQFVENIPLNGRSFQSLITIVPGTTQVPGGSPGQTGEFSINGQRTEANYFSVDGVSVNTGVNALAGTNTSGIGGSTPSETALGTTQSMVSVDALQEFRIATSTYSAEFGRTPGGQISLLTRSGTNEWHGSLFDYFRNDTLDANNWFNDNSNLPKTAERQNDFGGTLGGPIEVPGVYDGRNKTFFFFSYEGMRLRVPQPVQATMVPDAFLRQNSLAAIQPLLNAFPIQNGAEQGNDLALFSAAYSAPSTLDATSVRLDHTFGDKLKIFGRYSDSPSETVTRYSENLANLISTSFDLKTLTLGATSLFSPRLSNDFRFNATWNTGRTDETLDNFGGAQPLGPSQLFSVTPPTAYDFGMFLYFGTVPAFNVVPVKARQWQLNATDTFVLAYRTHVVKFGVDFRRLSTRLYENQLLNAFYFFSPADVLQNSASEAVASTYGSVPPEPVFLNLSAYVQDEWRTTDRLHLSLGLRWDLNPPPTNANGPRPYNLDQITNLTTAQLAPPGTPQWKTDYHAFAPRIGLAYQLHQRKGRETVLRGGFGLFFDTGNTQGAVGLNAIGFGVSQNLFGVGFPLTPAQNQLPPPSVTPPYTNYVFAFNPRLTLPCTLQWNVAVEQGLGTSQALTVSYVGASGRNLLSSRFLNSGNINPNFSLGQGLFVVDNAAESNYQALQAQFERRLASGLQASASYSWAHSIDNASSNFLNVAPILRGNSDFDIRHSFALALTYELPDVHTKRLSGKLLGHWALDARVAGRSALAFNVYSGYSYLSDGTFEYVWPNLVPGVPVYASDPTAPGGRVVNANAFLAPPTGEQGNEPRNFLRGFDLWQTDLAVRREFPLYERLKLQLRGEAFNVFNRPNFGQIDNNLLDGPTLFGLARNTLNNQLGGLNPLYQVGGPRSIQIALKLIF